MTRLFQFQELLQASHELDTQLAKVKGQLQEAQKHVSYAWPFILNWNKSAGFETVLNFSFVLAKRGA